MISTNSSGSMPFRRHPLLAQPAAAGEDIKSSFLFSDMPIFSRSSAGLDRSDRRAFLTIIQGGSFEVFKGDKTLKMRKLSLTNVHDSVPCMFSLQEAARNSNHFSQRGPKLCATRVKSRR